MDLTLLCLDRLLDYLFQFNHLNRNCLNRRSRQGHTKSNRLLDYSWSLFCFLLITEGVQSRLQRNSSFAFRNHLFGIPTIFEKNFKCSNIIESFIQVWFCLGQTKPYVSRLGSYQCCQKKLKYRIAMNLAFLGIFWTYTEKYFLTHW